MKRLIGFVACFSFIGLIYGSWEVKEVANDWKVTAVSLSTNSVTALPTTALSGRYKIVIENNDPALDIAIGTHSAFTYANGYVVKLTSGTVATGRNELTLPLGSGITVYGLGQASGSQGTVNVRIIEYK